MTNNSPASALAAHIEQTVKSWQRTPPSVTTLLTQTQAWQRDLAGSGMKATKTVNALAMVIDMAESANGVGMGAVKSVKVAVSPEMSIRFSRLAQQWRNALEGQAANPNARILRQAKNAWRPIGSIVAGNAMFQRASYDILATLDDAIALIQRKRVDDARRVIGNVANSYVPQFISDVAKFSEYYTSARSMKSTSEWGVRMLDAAVWMLRREDAPTAKANGLALPGAGDGAVVDGASLRREFGRVYNDLRRTGFLNLPRARRVIQGMAAGDYPADALNRMRQVVGMASTRNSNQADSVDMSLYPAPRQMMEIMMRDQVASAFRKQRQA